MKNNAVNLILCTLTFFCKISIKLNVENCAFEKNDRRREGVKWSKNYIDKMSMFANVYACLQEGGRGKKKSEILSM